MKAEKFPLTITDKGVSALIRKSEKLKDGKKLHYFIVEYILFGKRKQVWRSDLDEAKAVAREACIKIGNGVQSSLELRDTDRMAYVRAVEAVALIQVPIDTACREYADALQVLGGKASIVEACREWVKRNAILLPKITVADARASNCSGKSSPTENPSGVRNRLPPRSTVWPNRSTPKFTTSRRVRLHPYLAALRFFKEPGTEGKSPGHYQVFLPMARVARPSGKGHRLARRRSKLHGSENW